MKIINGTEKDYEIALQRLAREEMKIKLMNDIELDIEICKLMNTNPKEYLFELQELINSFCKKSLDNVKNT